MASSEHGDVALVNGNAVDNSGFENILSVQAGSDDVPLSTRARKKARRRERWEESWQDVCGILDVDGLDDRHAAHRVLAAHAKRVVRAVVKCPRTFTVVVRKLHEAITSGDLEAHFVLAAVDGKLAKEAIAVKTDNTWRLGVEESVNVLSYLPVHERAGPAVSAVCRAFESVSRRPLCWREVVVEEEGTEVLTGWSKWQSMILRKNLDSLDRFFDRFQMTETIRVTNRSFSHLDWFLAEARSLRELTLVKPVQRVIDRICRGWPEANGLFDDGDILSYNTLRWFEKYETCLSLRVLALRVVFSQNPNASDTLTLADMPLLEELDLRSVSHPGDIRFQARLQRLRRLTLVWQRYSEEFVNVTQLEALCPAAQLESITLIGIPWPITAEWLKACSWTLPHLRVLRLSICLDDDALRALLSRSPMLEELCILKASAEFFEALPGIVSHHQPLLKKVILGNVAPREGFGQLALPCTLPIDLALHPDLLDLNHYQVSMGLLPNDTSRNSICMRLLRLRTSRPRSIFRVETDRSWEQAGQQMNLCVKVDMTPLFMYCKTPLLLAERPKLNGKQVFKIECNDLLHPWDHRLHWNTLPEDVQSVYNSAVAECYNQRARYVLDPDESDGEAM